MYIKIRVQWISNISYCVESFGHIECYNDCLHRGSHLVEPLHYGVLICVICCHQLPVNVKQVEQALFHFIIRNHNIPISSYELFLLYNTEHIV